jgi:hypothetical protein
MPKSKSFQEIEPVPRYLKPDKSAPDYTRILEELAEYHRSLIGSSYYYIMGGDDCPALCRIVYGGGKIYFHEVVDHEQHGISDEDLEVAVRDDAAAMDMPGHYVISPQIEMKLRAILDFQ